MGLGGVAGGGVEAGSDRPITQVTRSSLTISQRRFGGFTEVIPGGVRSSTATPCPASAR